MADNRRLCADMPRDRSNAVFTPAVIQPLSAIHDSAEKSTDARDRFHGYG